MVKRIGIILFLAAVVGARHAVPLQGLPVLSDIAFAAIQENGQPCPPECVIDSMEIITYYPSPYGYYEELRGDKIIVGDTDNSHIDETHLPPSGTITFEPLLDDPDASDGSLYEGSLYYQGAIGGTKGKFRFYDGSDWQDLGGGGGDYWKPSTASGGSNNIYYTQSGNVGIGVEESDPIGAKLQVNPEYLNIGLIVRKGVAGSYASQTYSTPGSYSYYVRPGISSVRITAYGASGSGNYWGLGASGGMAQATITVVSGETLYIYVGAISGGASDVRRGGTALSNRIIVAGGGGSDSSFSAGACPNWTKGGAGGGLDGSGGGGDGGGGGTQSGGGAGGNGGGAGVIGQGGSGRSAQFCGGGGGGGGYYGGGGGGLGGGGGGGSSYVPTGGITQSGVQTGNGKVVIEPILSVISSNLMEWQNESGSAMSIIDASGNLALGSSTANGYKLYVNGSAYVTSGAWTASDLRFKENILPLDNSLDKILSIQPVSFDWNKSGYPDMNFDPNRQIGLVAQEVEKQIPELVHTDINGYKAVAYDKLTAVLVEAVKEQQAQMRNQQKKIEILELKLEELDEKK